MAESTELNKTINETITSLKNLHDKASKTLKIVKEEFPKNILKAALNKKNDTEIPQDEIKELMNVIENTDTDRVEGDIKSRSNILAM